MSIFYNLYKTFLKKKNNDKNPTQSKKGIFSYKKTMTSFEKTLKNSIKHQQSLLRHPTFILRGSVISLEDLTYPCIP
jgi:hypothetical protein